MNIYKHPIKDTHYRPIKRHIKRHIRGHNYKALLKTSLEAHIMGPLQVNYRPQLGALLYDTIKNIF